MLKEICCAKCNKLLLKLSYGEGEIKCKCGEIVAFRIISQKSLNEEIYSNVAAPSQA